MRSRLEEACPDGVDVYFDNVGGFVTDAVMEVLAYRARIAICGQISQYNLETPDNGPRNLRNLLTRQATIEGFIVGRFADRNEEALRRLTRWVSEGSLKYKEDVVDGLQNAPRAFMGLMRGENFGKQLIIRRLLTASGPAAGGCLLSQAWLELRMTAGGRFQGPTTLAPTLAFRAHRNILCEPQAQTHALDARLHGHDVSTVAPVQTGAQIPTPLGCLYGHDGCTRPS